MTAAVIVQDAMIAFEGALDIHPDHVAAYNRAVLSYALGDPDHMKQAFLTLIQVSFIPFEPCHNQRS